MAKKVWTAAARKAFAAKMKRARAIAGLKRVDKAFGQAKRRFKYRRRKNPTKAEVKAAAAKIAKAAGKLAWRGAKLTGRIGRESAKAAAREVKASICRPRAANPKRGRVRTAGAGFSVLPGGDARGQFYAYLRGQGLSAADARATANARYPKSRRRSKPKRVTKKRARRRNPFRVVIKAVPKGEYRRRKNPTSPLYYDGKNFSSVKSRRKTFSSVQPAEVVARHLLHRYPVLRKGYVVTLNSV